MERRTSTVAAATTLIVASAMGTSSAFVPPHQRIIIHVASRLPLCHRQFPILFNNNEKGSSSGNAEDYEEGEALAKEFYNLVRSKDTEVSPTTTTSSSPGVDDAVDAEREEYRRLLGYEKQEQQKKSDEQKAQQSPQSPPKSPLSPEDEANIRNRDAFATRREVQVSEGGTPTSSSSSSSRKKFTGAAANSPRLDSTGSPSAGLFSGRGGSVFSYPDGASSSAIPQQKQQQPRDARSRMMRSEFNLVSRASGVGLYALAALLAFSLVAVVYVGATGGITDGSERFVEAFEFNVIGDFTQEGNGITPEDWKDAVVPPRMEGTSIWL